MTKQINIRIDEKILEAIRKVCETDEFIKDRADFVRRAIEEKLLRDREKLAGNEKGYEFL